MTEEAGLKDVPLTQNFIRTLHKTLLRKDYTIYHNLPGGQTTSYTIHAGQYKTCPNSVITRYGDRFESHTTSVSLQNAVTKYGGLTVNASFPQ